MAHKPEDPDLLLAVVLRTMVMGEEWQPAMEPALRSIKNHYQYLWTMNVFHNLAGTRPDLRPAAQEAAGMVFHMATDGFQDYARPTEEIERYRPFVEGKSDGAGDPRFRHLFCRD